MISSTGGTQGAVNFSTYNAGKAFQWILTETLWTELGDYDVDAVNVFVGATSSPNYNSFQETLDPDLCNRTDTDDPLERARSRLMRPSTPEEVTLAAFEEDLGKGPVCYTHPDDEFVSRTALACPGTRQPTCGGRSRRRRPGVPTGWRDEPGTSASCSGRPARRGVLPSGGWSATPVLDLVGCYAYSAEKVGRDVGELCGIEPIGITATDDVDALLALEPDCVSYMAYRPNFDHLERILESGANVVTTMYMLAGGGYGEEPDAPDQGCGARAAGRRCTRAASIQATRRWSAMAASAMCSRIERLSILESLDIKDYANEQMFRAQGFDLDPDDPAATQACESACGSFKDQIPVMAKAMGLAIDGVAFRVSSPTANQDTDFGFMTVKKGRIAGFKGTIAGVKDGRSLIECSFVWKLGDDMTPSWPVTHGYVIEIDGVPGVRCRLEPLGGHFDGTVTTAMPVVNAIPVVCAAPPGMVNQMALPFVRAAGQFLR